MEFKKSGLNFNKIGQDNKKLFEASWQRSHLPCTLFSSRNTDSKEPCGSQHNLNALCYTKNLEINI